MIRNLSLSVILCFLGGIASLSAEANQQPLSGEEVVHTYLSKRVVDSEVAFIRMAIYHVGSPESETRRYRFLAMGKRTDEGYQSMLRLVRPKEVEGVTLLATQNGNDHKKYIYLPAVGSVNELVGDSLSGNFLGSDFTYEDLLAEIPTNHLFERLPDAVIHGAECYVVKATPEADNSQYHHRLLYIEKYTFLLRKVEYFSSADEKEKTLEAYGHGSEHIKGKSLRPRYAVMTHHQNDNVSVFNTVEARQNAELDADNFTPKAVEAMTPESVRNLIYDFELLIEVDTL